MSKTTPQIVIDKDKAVFWLDANGCWRNEHGKFSHKKIIGHFHSSIRRDRHGYYLSQKNENFVEKVYFHYEDQALFVFDLIQKREILLVLNTGQHLNLRPRKLFVRNDNLYMYNGEETVKFVEQGLMKIARLLQEDCNRLYIRLNDRRYRIPAIND